jgi:hypothetical protein
MTAEVRAVMERTASLFPDGTLATLRDYIATLEAERDALVQQLVTQEEADDSLRDQLAEARRALEQVVEVADRPIREANPFVEREDMGRIADNSLARIDALAAQEPRP